MENRKKTFVENVDRGVYDIKNEDRFSFKAEKGLTKEVILSISKEKNEEKWMTDFRLKALEIYNKTPLPAWGPDISELDLNNIVTYVRPETKLKGNWEEVPADIKKTFDLLGIPQAEKESLAGVGAQYDSEVVYHSIKQELLDKGVIYTDFESAVRDYGDSNSCSF